MNSTQCHQEVNKQIKVYPDNGLLLSDKKKNDLSMHAMNMNESQNNYTDEISQV